MDNLIARNRLLKEIREVYEYEYPTASGAFDDFVKRIIPNIINNQPIVDAVPYENVKEWFEEIDKNLDILFEKVGCNAEQKDGE